MLSAALQYSSAHSAVSFVHRDCFGQGSGLEGWGCNPSLGNQVGVLIVVI